MTPEQALKLLDEVTSKAKLERSEHILAVQAINILQEAIKPKEIIKEVDATNSEEVEEILEDKKS